MPRQEKFFEKSCQAFLSRNRTEREVGSEYDAPEQRGFQDGVDLRLGAMHRLFEREEERERETNRKVSITKSTKKKKKRKGMYA